MTYIEYLNQFNRWCEEDSPTDKAIILYYALLNLFNRRGWPRWAGVDTQRLMILARTEDKKTAYRARDALKKAGFIEYVPGKKGKVTQYQLKCWSEFSTENATESATKNTTESDTENATLNKTKTKNNTSCSSAANAARNEGGVDSPSSEGTDTNEGAQNANQQAAKKKREPKPIPHDHKAYKSAVWLSKKIQSRSKTVKSFNEHALQNWARDIDYINRIDGYDWNVIADVLVFCQSDPFWQNNILSGGKLRKQFMQLLLKMERKFEEED